MFCTNCGTKIGDGHLFCTSCGTPAPVMNTPNMTPESNNTPSQPAASTQPRPQVQPAQQPRPQVQPQPTQPRPQAQPRQAAPQPQTGAPKKSGKGPLIAVIAILVVLVLGIGIFAIAQSDLFGGNNQSASSNRDDDDDRRDDVDDNHEDESDDADDESDNTEIEAEDEDEDGLYEFDATQSFVENDVLPAYRKLYREAGDAVTMFYYNNDIVPELFLYATGEFYTFGKDGEVVKLKESRSDLLLKGIDILDYGKFTGVDDAYAALINPVDTSDYILPTSDREYITKEDLEGLTAEQCRIARNEIFARHGRRFDDETLQAYFDSKDWYNGTIDPDDFDIYSLNKYEQKNSEVITEYEREMGYR